MTKASLDSPFGALTLVEAAERIVALRWGREPGEGSPLLDEAKAQLAAYFDHHLGMFDLPLDWGTGLHLQVRRAMAAIPLGQTCSYGDIARKVGAPAQTVGQACGANPIPILIPCHRVLGRNGLGGFSAPGGIETKVALLRHEAAAGLLI